MRLEVALSAEATLLEVTMATEATLQVDFGQTQAVAGADIDPYTGDYAVTPTAGGQTLATRQKLMVDDVTIHPIPYYAVGNNAGGNTVYIGGADEIM